jgi:hypothetical protein
MRQHVPDEHQEQPVQPVRHENGFTRSQFRERDYAERREDYPDEDRDR